MEPGVVEGRPPLLRILALGWLFDLVPCKLVGDVIVGFFGFGTGIGPMASTSVKLTNVYDYEKAAQCILSDSHFGYYASGATDEVTLRNNIKAYRKIELIPRVLINVSRMDTSTTVLGQKINIPIIAAPMAVQKIAHPKGEIGVANACAQHGTIMTVSTLSSYSIEDLGATTNSGLWFQLYIFSQRNITETLVRRAEAAGFKAICLTVDNTEAGRREVNRKLFFQYPDYVRPENFVSFYEEQKSRVTVTNANDFIVSLYDQTLSWDDVAWLKSITKLPIILKGIMSPLDAKLAAQAGVSAVVVSNHGGRQLDTSPATISCLPHIVEALRGTSVEVIVDGGIRRGTDIVKAIALGAKAVMVGRPLLWGLAVDGKDGVSAVLKLLRDELVNAMRLCGCPSLRDINRSLIAPSDWAKL